MDFKEFEIPVPWGHVAVKAWGDESNLPVVVLHGLGDNAGSFDRLMPFLPPSFYYMCVDLPSHGKSSPYPPYMFITAMDNIMTTKLIVDFVNRKKYIFIGHSWGGQTALLFAQLYPEYFIKLIVLDTFYLYPLTIPNFQEVLRMRVDGLIKTNEFAVRKQVVYYTYEQAINKLMNNRLGGIKLNKESAEAIGNRAIVQEGDKYRLSTDSRLKYFLNLLADMEFSAKLVEEFPIHCPFLIIYSTDYQYYFYKHVIDKYSKLGNCSIVRVEGSHDVHSNTPELVAPIISKFLANSSCKL